MGFWEDLGYGLLGAIPFAGPAIAGATKNAVEGEPPMQKQPLLNPLQDEEKQKRLLIQPPQRLRQMM